MDEIQQYEIIDLIDLIPWANKTSYEQMRYIVWASLKPYLKNQKQTPQRLIPLYTDNASDNVPDIPEDELNRLEAIKHTILSQFENKK